jgi:hypothetical protein
MSDPLAQHLPAEQHPVILIVRPELAPFLVEFRDVRPGSVQKGLVEFPTE